MDFISKLIDKLDLSILFQPRIDDETERENTIAGITRSIATIIETVLEDIETEKLGFYPHPENQNTLNSSADSLGYIQYMIKQQSGERLELSPLSLVSCNSIKMTENFVKLKTMIKAGSYSIELKEINIDAEGMKVFEEPNENTPDFARYFVILISGW